MTGTPDIFDNVRLEHANDHIFSPLRSRPHTTAYRYSSPSRRAVTGFEDGKFSLTLYPSRTTVRHVRKGGKAASDTTLKCAITHSRAIAQMSNAVRESQGSVCNVFRREANLLFSSWWHHAVANCQLSSTADQAATQLEHHHGNQSNLMLPFRGILFPSTFA